MKTAEMQMDSKKYISLSRMIAATKLPRGFLIDLVEAGKIPALLVGRQYRFNLEDVHAALQKLAESGGDKI